MATAHPAPDPFDPELEALLRDPAVIARLDDLHGRFERGELELHDHEAARAIVEQAERRDAGQEGGTPASARAVRLRWSPDALDDRA